MTRDQLKSAVRSLHPSLYVVEHYGEIAVKVRNMPEATYYTNDRYDAYATAVDMAKRQYRADLYDAAVVKFHTDLG